MCVLFASCATRQEKTRRTSAPREDIARAQFYSLRRRVYLRSPGGKVSKGTADRSFSSERLAK